MMWPFGNKSGNTAEEQKAYVADTKAAAGEQNTPAANEPLGRGDKVILLQSVESTRGIRFPKGHKCMINSVDGDQVDLLLRRDSNCSMFNHYAEVHPDQIQVVTSLHWAHVTFKPGTRVRLKQEVTSRQRNVFTAGHVAVVYAVDKDKQTLDLDLDQTNYAIVSKDLVEPAD